MCDGLSLSGVPGEKGRGGKKENERTPSRNSKGEEVKN